MRMSFGYVGPARARGLVARRGSSAGDRASTQHWQRPPLQAAQLGNTSQLGAPAPGSYLDVEALEVI